MLERTWGIGAWIVSVVSVLGLGTACLEPPPLIRRDGGEAMDVPRTPIEVTGVVIEALDGRGWPLDATPRRPRIEVGLSRELDEDVPLYLLTGAPDEALLDDLTSSPLRSENLMRVVPCAVHRELRRIELVPDAPLAAGASFTVALGAWARSGRETMGEPFALALQVSRAPEAGAIATASWPPDGASDVGIELPEVVVRFDGPLASLDGALALSGPGGDVVATLAATDCARLGLDGHCLALTGFAALAPLATYRVALRGAIDATGAPLPSWEASFRTASAADAIAPSPSALPCARDEQRIEAGCLLVTDQRIGLRIAASEAVIAQLLVGAQSVIVHAPRGSASLTVRGLAPETSYRAVLRLTDTAGLVSEQRIELTTLPRLPRLVIAEVLADPRGREPTQEYVEIFNAGEERIELAGMTIADGLDREGDPLPELTLSPGGRALLVADGFDPDATEDAPVPPGAKLIRIGASLGDAGLSNSGELLVLRDASGARLSLVPAMEAPEPGACLVRVTEDPLSESPRDYEHALAACSPAAE